MTAIVFEPHQDDCALFSVFNALRHRAHVVTVLRSEWQERHGISQDQREYETALAMDVLNLRWEQWPYADVGTDWDAVALALELLDERLKPETVFAPAVEAGGHEHHNRVGALAVEVFGDRVTSYLTYTVDGKSRKSVGGRAVEYEPEWVTLKLRALACYRSQIETVAAGCTPHFVRGIEEYVAA